MSYQEVDLHTSDTQVLGGNYLIEPLTNHIDVFFQLSMVLLFLLAATVSLRIYLRWQQGEETEVLPVISRWFFGLVLAFCLVAFLKYYTEHQAFGRPAPVIPTEPGLTIPALD